MSDPDTPTAPGEPPRRLTLRDVSEASGVSEMTVSRVLRNRGDVSEATRNKVLSAAKELGYVPNRIAGALASSRVNLVAVIVPNLSNMVYPDVLTGITRALEGTPLQPVVGVTNYSPEREEAVLFELLSWRPAGVIVAGLEHSEAAEAMLTAADIPVVEIMDVDGDPIDAVVGISHRRAGRHMAREILKAGYTQVGYIGTGLSLDHRARKRFEGFTAGLARAGVEIRDREFYDSGSGLRTGRELTERLLTRTPEIDVIYYSNDLNAAGGLMWCLEQGFDVPGRVALAGFNGVDLLDGLPRRLTTMDSCRLEIGRRAAAIIAARAADPAAEAERRVELKPQIEPGDTMYPARL